MNVELNNRVYLQIEYLFVRSKENVYLSTEVLRCRRNLFGILRTQGFKVIHGRFLRRLGKSH